MTDKPTIARYELNDDELDGVSGGVSDGPWENPPDSRATCTSCGHSFPFSTQGMGIHPKYCPECGRVGLRVEPL
ncbi:MAG: hypothetical protein ACOYD7_04965 [Raoultibacter sp.]|jgi:hypothetical protein